MKMKFTLIGNSCWILDIDGEYMIGCDPALAPAGTVNQVKGRSIKRKIGPEYNDDEITAVDLWLISHSHFDHVDDLGIRKIKEGADVVCHKNVLSVLRKRKDLNIRPLDWRQTTEFYEENFRIKITAVPAFHGKGIWGKMMVGTLNGYLVTINKGQDTKTVYVCSDTVYSKQIVRFMAKKSIDLMIPNLGSIYSAIPGGPFTMNMAMLEKMESELTPQMVLPIHINDYSHFETRKPDFAPKWKILENGESMDLFV